MNKYLFETTFFKDNHDIIDNIMEKRGNWSKGSLDDKLAFLYADGHALVDDKVSHKKALIKNVVEVKSFGDKYKFYSQFKRYNPKILSKYMMKQYYVTLDNYKKLDKSIFDNNVWIIKPVKSGEGKGVTVMKDYDDYISYVEKFSIDHPILIQFGFALEEYITNVLLLNNRKFHIRVYYLYFNGVGYLFRYGKILSAREDYNSNWTDRMAQDTHYFGFDFMRYPDEIINAFGKEKEQHVYDQMKDLFHHITKFIHFDCYTDSTLGCYHVFGADIVILDDYSIKMYEINKRIGIAPGKGELWLDFVKAYIESQIEVTVDTLIPPKNNMPKLGLFIDVTAPIVNKNKGGGIIGNI